MVQAPRHLLVAAIFLPWLFPFTAGPSTAFYPWIFSVACIAIALSLSAHRSSYNVDDVPVAWSIAAVASMLIGSLQIFGLSAYFSPWISSSPAHEVFGNLRQRNQFGTLMAVGTASSIWLMVKVKKAPCSRAHTLVAALLVVGGAMSFSRTFLVELLALLAMFVMCTRPRRSSIKVAASLLLIYIVAATALSYWFGSDFDSKSIFARLSDTSDPCHSRLTLWSNILHLISLRPLTGWGWGELGYAHYSTLYDGARFCEILDNAHNLPLHLAVELGLPFAIAVCGAIGWFVWTLKPWAERDRARQLAWAVLMIIGIHSMLEYPLWYGPFQMAVLLCICMLWRKPESAQHASEEGESAVRAYVKPVAWLISYCLMAGCIYAAWDYHRVSQLYLPGDARDAAYQDRTLEKVSSTRLFRNQVEFAELMTTPLNPATAPSVYILSRRMLHFSAEPSVIEKAIESSRALGFFDEANFHMDRYQAAFPDAYQRWLHQR